MAAKPAGFLRRAAAYLIDITVLYLYILVLSAASVGIDRVLPFHHLMAGSYLLRHVISFTALTLPFALYFILMERSRRQATLGKSVMKLRVTAEIGGRASTHSVVIRNALKFLPWEIAHTHIHLNPDFLTTGRTTTTGWVIGVGLPLAAMCIYAALIVVRRDRRSMYELLSRTRTVRVSAGATLPVR